MPKVLRAAALASAAILALTGTGPASAALTSAKLFVTGASQALGGTGGLEIKFETAPTDNDIAKVTLYVPTGYQLATTQSPGTRLGTASARILARDLSAALPVTGELVVANPTDHAATGVLCTGTPMHSAIWALEFTAAGARLTVPVFVDAETTPLTSFAVATIVICLPPSDVPPGTPGRAPLGAKVLSAEFSTSALVNPRAHGEYRWRATLTGYGTATGSPDPATTVEVQSLVELPTQLTLRARPARSAKRGLAVVSYAGSLRANENAVPDASVDVLKGATAQSGRKLRTQTTDDNGAFVGTFSQQKRARPGVVFLVARATLEGRDLDAAACTASFLPPASPFPIPCINATVGGFTVSSRTVRVTVPALPKPKAKKKR